MKLLITGASGFIGGYVAREALNRGHKVVALSRSIDVVSMGDEVECMQCDLCDLDGSQLQGMAIDAVIHLAAGMGGSPEAQYHSTIAATEQLLKAMLEAGIRRLVGVSSIAVLDYRSVPPLSMIDENVMTPGSIDGMGSYPAAKLRQEALFQEYSRRPDVHCVILRPGLVYDSVRMIDAHAGILKGPIKLLVSHKGDVPVMNIKSLSDAILRAVVGEGINGEVLHVVDDNLPGQKEYIRGLRARHLLHGSGVTVPWRLLAFLATLSRAVFYLAGKRAHIPEVLMEQGFSARLKPFRFSNNKAKSLLGWAPCSRFLPEGE